MATVPDIRPVIAALKKRLDDDLPAALTAEGATQPQQILDHIPPIETLLAFPTIAIGEGVDRIDDDTGHASTGAHELSVVIYAQASDQQALVDALRDTRYAVVKTILDGRVLEDATTTSRNRAWGVVYKRGEPGPTLGDVQAEQVVSWMSWVRLVIECRSDSDWD